MANSFKRITSKGTFDIIPSETDNKSIVIYFSKSFVENNITEKDSLKGNVNELKNNAIIKTLINVDEIIFFYNMPIPFLFFFDPYITARIFLK